MINRYDTWVAEGKNDIPDEELDAIFNGTSDDKSATNTAESIPVSNSKFTSSNTAKEVTYNGNQNLFFGDTVVKCLFLTEKSIEKVG